MQGTSGSVSRVQGKRRRRSAGAGENKHRRFDEADMRREMQQNHRESMARLSHAFGLGDPDAQTENELVVRGKRKFEETNIFSTVAKDDDGIQFFRKMFHPDKKATRSPRVNAICDLLMEQLLEAQKHKKR